MQITKHIHALKIPFQITVGPEIRVDRFVYVYLICGKSITLIDTGVASSRQVIFDYLKKTGRKPEEISLIVLTHSHPDHMGAAQAVQKLTGCKVAAHRGEKAWIEDVHLQARERPVPQIHSLVEGPVKVDQVLEEGEILQLGDRIHIEVLHTPGHSKGSISLRCPQERALFCGDAIPLVGDTPIYEDVLASASSIKKLMGMRGIDVLLASWDKPRRGDEAYAAMKKGLDYLERVHKEILRAVSDAPSLKPLEMSKRVLQGVGLPATAMNPLFVRTVEAHLAASHHQSLSGD